MLMHEKSSNWSKQLYARPVHEPPGVQPLTDEHTVASEHGVATPEQVEPPVLVVPCAAQPLIGSHCSQ
jgi:hypothetical protein